jgi:mono/diheme cytochrome c family protein
VPLALTGYQIGLLAVALTFIAFALVVALVVPRARPDFPSKYLGWFIAGAIVLFASQLTAVILLAEIGESDEHSAAEAPPNEPGPAEPGATETTPTETTPAQPTGDATAGRTVFLNAGCTSCHTLADAKSTGTVGPNLDDAKPPDDLVIERVTNGKAPMPPFKDQLSEKQIQDVAAYVSTVAGS